ncbi:MAG TPA: type II secretion system protein GspM [Myxococcales bacterium]|nr:type II secretion system protein GspM [Myxococcales bacterium]
MVHLAAIDKARALAADAVEYLAAASPRERRLVGFAAGGVLLFFLLVTYAAFSSAISRRTDSLAEKRGDFEKVQLLARNYGQQEQERQMLEARLRQSPPGLMAFVDGLAKQEGLDIASMSDLGLQRGGQNGRPRESSVEVNLGKVPLDKLTRLLESIERSPGVVRVRRLRVSKSRDSKDALDVSLTVSTWQGA